MTPRLPAASVLGSPEVAAAATAELAAAAATASAAAAAASSAVSAASAAAAAASSPGDLVPAWRAALAGSSGTVIARTILNPVDKAAIMMQVQNPRGGLLRVLQTYRREGVRSMFQGATANALRVGIFGGIVSIGYAHGLKLHSFEERDPWEPVWRGSLGATASLVGNVLSHPLDVIRTRITLQTPGHSRYLGVWHAARTIAAQEGVGGLYRGLTPACMSVVPEVFVQLALYDFSVHHAQTAFGLEPTVPLFAATGAFVGVVSQIVVYPLDLARRRMQHSSTAAQRGVVDVLMDVVRVGGVRAAYSGVGVACLRVGAALGIAMVIRDAVLGRLQVREKRGEVC